MDEITHSRTWDLPIVRENDDIKLVLVVLIGRCYTWVVDDMENLMLKGTIPEHDAIKLLKDYNGDIKAKDICYSGRNNLIFFHSFFRRFTIRHTTG